MIYKKRNVHGFLLLDKPEGISSNCALQKVKTIFHAKKAGYVGTLDPLATGMLPICFGESTKFSYYLSQFDKKYNVIAKFGETTSTSDSEGDILKKRPVFFNLSCLRKALDSFTGLISQIPSMYSAIKYKGIPLYKYARKGINITRNARKIFIYKFHYISQKNNFFEFNIHCSKGTYVRTLIEDLGEKLGCGAHIVKLRRDQVGFFPSSQLTKISFLYEFLRKEHIYNTEFFKIIDNILIPTKNMLSFFSKNMLFLNNC